MEYNEILVYMLASALLMLLVLSIIVAVYLIKILRSVQRISAKAEHASDNISAFSDTLKKAAIPAGAIGVLKTITKEIINHKSKEKSDERQK